MFLGKGTGFMANRQRQKTDDAGFDTFWQEYPRAISKSKAREAWDRACKNASAGAIIEGLRVYAFAPDPQFVPFPATWLNQERWIPAVVRAAPTVRAPVSRTSWMDKYDGGPRGLPAAGGAVTIDADPIAGGDVERVRWLIAQGRLFG